MRQTSSPKSQGIRPFTPWNEKFAENTPMASQRRYSSGVMPARSREAEPMPCTCTGTPLAPIDKAVRNVAQAVPAVFSLRARLPGQALRRGEQIGTGHHALGRHLQAGHGVEQCAPHQQGIHAAQRRAGLAVARVHAIGNGDLRVAGGRVEPVLDQLAMTFDPEVIDVAVGQVQQAVRLAGRRGNAVEHLRRAVVLDSSQPRSSSSRTAGCS